MKFLRSLLAKYMLIIVTAICLVQIIFVITAMLLFNTGLVEEKNEELQPSYIEEEWHNEAGTIQNADIEVIDTLFTDWKEKYPDASMFWVNDNGELAYELGEPKNLPTSWTALSTARFIKDRYDSDPFTVIAFIGNEENNGFISLEIPREELNADYYEEYSSYLMVFGIIIIIFFIAISFLFFIRIRRRLLHLQEAMITRDVDGLPIRIKVKKQDEIGQLEQTFNSMVEELKESREREQEEEQLRRNLIANLSHDLRTPLTKINANIISLKKEVNSLEGKRKIKSVETSIQHVDELMENLMSYTLLSVGKYKQEPKKLDIDRFVRTSLASWYPLFEQKSFEAEIDVQPFKRNEWYVDPIWMNRILDNIFQNVLRHAKSGKYLCVYTESTATYDAIIIKDRGPGMKKSISEGAGIGLSIVDKMIQGLHLQWELDSSLNGTTIKIKRYLNETGHNKID